VDNGSPTIVDQGSATAVRHDIISVKRPQAPLDLGLGREASPSFAHRLEKNAWSWKSLVNMGHLLLENGHPERTRECGGRFRGGAACPGDICTILWRAKYVLKQSLQFPQVLASGRVNNHGPILAVTVGLLHAKAVAPKAFPRLGSTDGDL
jgi:hypothetical protein